MKAMILAAGYGTRLSPYTRICPKPLFTIAGRPLLDILIERLAASGCEAAVVNTHHLHEQIESWAAEQNYPIPVHLRYEDVILGPGGAVKNVADFWDDRPFMVINGDILTSIDFKQVYEFHLSHPYPATLALCGDPEFNTVSVTPDGFVSGFQGEGGVHGSGSRLLTFTGVQAFDRRVLDYIPGSGFASSIRAFESMIQNGDKIRAWIAGPEDRWADLGTLERYKKAAYQGMAEKAVQSVWPKMAPADIRFQEVQGDGSDRIWTRLVCGGQSLMMADHGLRTDGGVAEVDSFISIGRLLYSNGVPAPRIIAEDRHSGLVVMEDLGDVNLQEYIRGLKTETEIETTYQIIIDLLIHMADSCRNGFDSKAAYQTACYDREVIIENECRYFVEAFLNPCLGMDVSFESLAPEFNRLADRIWETGAFGFMHRDFQSRNIMVKDGRFYLIDFQGGRIGPVQYDLASLLIDPYAGLNPGLRQRLADYCASRRIQSMNAEPRRFHEGYEYCALSRNMQILGAFGYLSRVKRKKRFEAYIPRALETLLTLSAARADEFPGIHQTAGKAVSTGNINTPVS